MIKYNNFYINKNLSQIFLTNYKIIKLIFKKLHLKIGEYIIEIGPGLGSLTELIINNISTKKNPLYAIEIDNRFVKNLKKKFGKLIKIYKENILNFNFFSLLKNNNLKKIRIIGNLPYNISKHILIYLIKFYKIIIDQQFMLQKEFVDKIISKPGNKNFGKLSITIQYYYYVKKILDISNTSFYPKPKIKSSIIKMIPHNKYKLSSDYEKKFHTIINKAFSQRRKIIKNTLSIYKNINFKKLNINSKKRPEELSILDYINIAKSI